MAAEIQEKIWAGMRTWDIKSFPPAGFVKPYGVPHDVLLHLKGAHIGPRGRLEWRGDRLKFAQHGDAGTPIRWVDYGGWLCMVVGTKLYPLRSAWSGVSTAQWTYGYEITLAADDSANPWAWQPGLELGAACDLFEMRDVLFLVEGTQATQRYDKTDVEVIGLAAPETAFTVLQDFVADYTAGADAGGYQTVAQYKITLTAAPRNITDVWAYLDFTAAGLQEILAEWEFQVSAASAVTASVNMLGLSNVLGQDRADWATHVAAGVFYRDLGGGAAYHIYLGDGDGDWADETNTLTASTTYYARFHRTGNQITFSVYSDSARTTLVAEVELERGTAFRYLYAASMMGTGGGAATISAYVENLSISTATLSTGVLPVGRYAYYCTFGNDEFESMPSPIMDVWVAAASKQIELAGIPTGPVGVTWRKLYRAYTSSEDQAARGADFQYLATIADNTTTTFIDDSLQGYLGEPIAFDHALPPRGGIGCWHKDRGFLAAPAESSRSYDDYETDATLLQNTVFWSELDEPYYYPGANQLQIGDSAAITAVVSWGDHIYFFKTNSLWVLSGYGEDTWVLEKLADVPGPLGDYGEVGGQVALGHEGIVWATYTAIYFYDGASIRILAQLGDRYKEPYIAFGSHVAYADHCFYIRIWVVDDGKWHLFRWRPQEGTWQHQYFAAVATGFPKLLGVNRDPYNTHVLAFMPWVAGGTNYLTVLDGGHVATDEDTEGSSYSDLYAPVAVTLPPVVAPPGYEIVPLEVWIDGSWDVHGTAAKHVKLFVNTDAGYSDTAGQNAWETTPDAPQGGDVVGIPSGYIYDSSTKMNAARVWYVQLAGEYAKDFLLNAVGLRYYLRPARGA